MAIKKIGTRWKIDFRIGEKRYRYTANTKIECIQYRDKQITNKNRARPDNDNRQLDEIISTWYEARGIELADNERTLKNLNRFCTALDNPVAKQVTAKEWHRFKKMKRDEGMGDKTLNNIPGYVNAVFNFLSKNGIIGYSNPLQSVEKIRIHEKELIYLTSDEIQLLFQDIQQKCVNPHVYMITKICLSTGARWGEIESRKDHHFKDNQVCLTYTKSKKNRVIPLDPELFQEVKQHIQDKGEFTNSQEAFRRALLRSGIRTVRGQASHVLRHTFASHFMMNGGNIRVLQTILGHSDIKMTMKYAKFSKDHLTDAVRLNPLNKMDTSWTPKEKQELSDN
ncbi:MAG: phage integrase [Endozoicomonas sp.]|uniref:phage integrase n=1 Tax=Endozoicomonas sp. TaxID=1892382 RepID=UPI003D9BFB16